MGIWMGGLAAHAPEFHSKYSFLSVHWETRKAQSTTSWQVTDQPAIKKIEEHKKLTLRCNGEPNGLNQEI